MYITLLHDDFFPCNNQLTVGLSIVHTFAIVCFSVLEREMQALRAEKGGGDKEKERFRSSKVVTNVVHMPVPPPLQSIIFHVPKNLNPHVENPTEG